MKLTHENIHAVATAGCGFNSAQLRLLGVQEQKKGWLNALIGGEISEADYEKLMALKGKKRSERKAILGETKPLVETDELFHKPPAPEAIIRWLAGVCYSEANRLANNCDDGAARWATEILYRAANDASAWLKGAGYAGAGENDAANNPISKPALTESPEDFANSLFRENGGNLD